MGSAGPRVLALTFALAACMTLALPPPPSPPPPSPSSSPPPVYAITDVTHPRCASFVCSLELCLPIEDCDGEVVNNATECGCCPLCIKYLDEGRACGPHGVLRFPEISTTMCRPPLRCVKGYCRSGGEGANDEVGPADR